MKLFLVTSLLISVAHCMPQDGVSAADIAKQADSSRYGSDSGDVDSEVLGEIFGTDNVKNYAEPSDSKKNDDHYGSPAGQIDDNKFEHCSDYADYGFECTPYYLCNDGFIVTDGSGGLIDIRLGEGENSVLDPESSKCEGYLDVCCRSEEYADEPLPLPEPKTTTTTTTEKPKTRAPVTPKPYQRQCGRRNPYGIGVRIQNDDDYLEKGTTQFGEWPHMCAILRKAEIAAETVNLYVCGASLIAPGIALTAAHCVYEYEPSNLVLRCGEWDTQQKVEIAEHEDIFAKSVSIHPSFNRANLQNDFALVHLEEEFVLKPHIDTICLPNQYDKEYSYLGNECFATGWGKDKFGQEGNYQVILKKLQMDLVSHDQCQKDLRSTRLGKRFRLDESFICAGGESGKDTCKGDGGGPLVCPTKPGVAPHEQTYVQAGIVAWGIGCGDDVPGVYAKVSDSMCFIDWATKCKHGQDADYYGYEDCERWGKREYCRAHQEIERLAAKNPRDRKIKKYEVVKANFEKAVYDCEYGYQDLDCSNYNYLERDVDSDDIDISTNARAEVKSAAISEEESSDDKKAEDDDDDDATDPRSAVDAK